MRVKIEVDETELEGDNGRPIDGIVVICTRCNHEVEVYGVEEASILRGAVMLREECPNKEKNFYYDPETEDDSTPPPNSPVWDPFNT